MTLLPSVPPAVSREALADFVERHRNSADAELAELITTGELLARAPARHAESILELGALRLRSEKSRRLLAELVSQLLDLHRGHGLSPYGCAEAMRICLGDVAQLEELARADVPRSAIQVLNSGLLTKVLDLVVRILRNLRIRLTPDEAVAAEVPVRPLSQLLGEDPAPADLTSDPDRPVLIIATAGRGTRLRTTVPKGFVTVGGIPMIIRTIRTARTAGIDQFVFVVKYQAAAHAAFLRDEGRVLVQQRAEGTAHSAAAGLAALPGQRAPVMLSFSDTPFLTPECFSGPLQELSGSGAAFVFSTFPTAPGDVVGQVERDVSGDIRSVGQLRMGATSTGEGDGGVYCMRPGPAYRALLEVRNDNVRREYGLPDIAYLLRSEPGAMRAHAGRRRHFASVNTPAELVLANLQVLVGIEDPLNAGDAEQRTALDYLARYGGSKSADLFDAAVEKVLGNEMNRLHSTVGPALDLRSREVGR